MFFDIGANLTDRQYQGEYHGKTRHAPDLDQVLQRARKVGVSQILLTVGCLEDVAEAMEVADRYDAEGRCIFLTLGCHPTHSADFVSRESYLDDLRKCFESFGHRVRAVGEMGLDYARLHFADKESQKVAFRQQMQLVKEFGLPMFLHLREAQEDFVAILRETEHLWRGVRGVVHSFTGSSEEATQLLTEFPNLDIGINGCSLKQRTDMLRVIPLDRLHLETDCPWCSIKPTSDYYSLVKTQIPQVNKPDKWTAEKAVKGRGEPQHIVQVAEVAHQIVAPELPFNNFDWAYDTISKNPQRKDEKARALKTAERKGKVDTEKKWLGGQNNASKARLHVNNKKLEEDTGDYTVQRTTQEFGKALQQARAAKKMSQKELATNISEKVTVVQDYENGKAIPCGPVIQKMNRVLATTLPKIEKKVKPTS
ncbi:MAG: hypothetical protein KVP17_001116 [Porospora cf. gigantea B]|uniref:uncharacterized protein n=1 Tax=Porospora cf. gigantea B TaxID=2853592 RepID=UPI003571CCD5|nr:MAG: hypothetical protein KVP17_001116 [Porospora cf. gigantea B]